MDKKVTTHTTNNLSIPMFINFDVPEAIRKTKTETINIGQTTLLAYSLILKKNTPWRTQRQEIWFNNWVTRQTQYTVRGGMPYLRRIHEIGITEQAIVLVTIWNNLIRPDAWIIVTIGVCKHEITILANTKTTKDSVYSAYPLPNHNCNIVETSKHTGTASINNTK